VVKLGVVNDSTIGPSSTKPIGAFEALVKGFDRVAAAPLLLLPSLVLDLLLWLGPHVKIKSLVEWVVDGIVIPSNATVTLYDQIRALRTGLLEIGDRFNLLTTLSSLPVGVPSLMSSRMPVETPLGLPISVSIAEPAYVVGLWLLLTVIGLGLGSRYHLWIARRIAPPGEAGNGWKTWLRIMALAAIAYVTITAYLVVSLLAASLIANFVPFLGVVILFLSFTLLFWLVVYLFFTPHGIVRYKMGLLQALMESAAVVRLNMMPTLSFLALAFAVSWLTSQVWLLPPEASWLGLLALLWHAFVSSMLWLGSYAFYQGQRDWLIESRGTSGPREMTSEPPETL
jgi:hypothetical protein